MRACWFNFSRFECHHEVVNLLQAHLILQVLYNHLTPNETNFVINLVHANIFSIVERDESKDHIDEGLLEALGNMLYLIKYATASLMHNFNVRCQKCVSKTKT